MYTIPYRSVGFKTFKCLFFVTPFDYKFSHLTTSSTISHSFKIHIEIDRYMVSTSTGEKKSLFELRKKKCFLFGASFIGPLVLY